MRTEILKVKAMTCGRCTSAVAKALQDTRGVKDVAVDLGRGQATIRFDERAASIEDLRDAVVRAGFEVVDERGPSKAGGGCCDGR